MKKLISTILTLLLVSFSAIAQPCLPDGITFTTQSQIDSFQINYPNCTEIGGDVEINGSNITDLIGLNSISFISGNLIIINNEELTSLAGLETLNSIGIDLQIKYNPLLDNLTGLNNLTFVGLDLSLSENNTLSNIASLICVTNIGGSIYINDNDNLINLEGLNNLTSLKDNLVIIGNSSLSSLFGLDNISIIEGQLSIFNNYSLTELSNFNNLYSIGGDLRIIANLSLTNLSGLDNIISSSIEDIEVYNNVDLSTCDAESICNYLSSPNGEVNIYNNAPGCNSIEEVQAACDTVSIHEVSLNDCFVISPNPCSHNVKLSFTVYEEGFVVAELFEISGNKVKDLLNETKKPGTYKMEFNVSDLYAGIYFVTLKLNSRIQTKKIIKL